MYLQLDLDWLANTGHTVDRTPITLDDGRVYFNIDGKPRTREQIEKWVCLGTIRLRMVRALIE
jgi:hypothetical protein